MLFRCLTVLLALSLSPSSAYAVLDPAKAAKLDQNPSFAGCSAIGSGGTANSKLCSSLLKPEEYCAYYIKSPIVAGAPEVKAAYKACTDFYKTAIDGLRLACEYEGDSSAVLASGSKAAAKVSGASSAQSAAGSALACGRKVYFYYSDVLNDQQQRLTTAANAAQKALTAVADKSAEVVKTEVSCDKNGTPGYPPGYMLAGLAAAGLNDVKKTKTNVSSVMANLGKMVNDNIEQAQLYSGRISQRETGLSTITGGSALDKPREDVGDSAVDEGGPGIEKTPSGKMTGKAARKIVSGTARNTTQDAAIHLAQGDNPFDLHDFLLATERQLVKDAAHDSAYGLVVALGIHAMQDGTIKKSDALIELASFGVGIFGGVVGAPALGVALTGEVVAYVGERIAEKWSEYDKEVARGFQNFAQAHQQQLPQATSAQIAQAYAPEKAQFAYCSKCNLQEQNYGCPGYLGAQHGYNPNYSQGAPPATNAQPFSNPWLAKAYQQYRARATASSQFSGIGNVPPTSKAP